MLTARARRLILLLAALTALPVAGCAGISTTPSPTGLGVQNGVAAFIPVAPTLVGPIASRSSCSQQGFTVSAAPVASGFCVAAESGGTVDFAHATSLRSGRNIVEGGGLNEGDALAATRDAKAPGSFVTVRVDPSDPTAWFETVKAGRKLGH